MDIGMKRKYEHLREHPDMEHRETIACVLDHNKPLSRERQIREASDYWAE